MDLQRGKSCLVQLIAVWKVVIALEDERGEVDIIYHDTTQSQNDRGWK